MAFIFTHRTLEQRVGDALVACGVPQERILFDYVLEIDKGNRRDADVVVLAEDGKTILLQVEVKMHCNRLEDAYANARRSLAGLWLRHRCFVATTDNGGVMRFSEVADGRPLNWIDVSDEQALKNLIGDYGIASAQVIQAKVEKRERVIADECRSLKKTVLLIGIGLLIPAMILELFGREFTWKIYYLLSMVLLFLGAAHGWSVKLRWGDKEIVIHPPNDDKNLEKREGRG